jgi:hypothetical protein
MARKKRSFYVTKFVVTVLSEYRLTDGVELSAVDYAISDGDCSGEVEQFASKKVSAKVMAKLLKKQGSDPGFFQLTKDGKDLSDD